MLVFVLPSSQRSNSLDRQQFVEREVQTDSSQVKEQDGLWHPNAATVGGAVGPETENHEYKSLLDCVGGVHQPLSSVCGVVQRVASDACRRGINAMLNHRIAGGSIHFGISDNGTVEEGLALEQSKVLDELRKTVSNATKTFCPSVELSFVQIKPVNLRNDKHELTGRWRFDIAMKPHPRVVQISEDEIAFYRQGSRNVAMSYDMFMTRVKFDCANNLLWKLEAAEGTPTSQKGDFRQGGSD